MGNNFISDFFASVFLLNMDFYCLNVEGLTKWSLSCNELTMYHSWQIKKEKQKYNCTNFNQKTHTSFSCLCFLYFHVLATAIVILHVLV